MVKIRKITDEYLKLRIFMVLRTHSDTYIYGCCGSYIRTITNNNGQVQICGILRIHRLLIKINNSYLSPKYISQQTVHIRKIPYLNVLTSIFLKVKVGNGRSEVPIYAYQAALYLFNRAVSDR